MTDVPDNREVYPSAPLKLVACELRLQLAPGADIGSAANPFYEAVEEAYPLQGPPPEQGMRVDIGPTGPVQTLLQNGFRYLSRDKTNSVAATSTSLIIETSAYTRFEDFARTIGDAVTAMADLLKVASVERIGLRYIDEIVVADLPGQTLEGYFSSAWLACSRAVEGLGEPAEFLISTSYNFGQDRYAVMRAGRVSQPIVATNGPLRIPHPSDPPLFVIDVDCAWSARTTAPLAFDRDAVHEVLTDLHVPVRALFESTITDKLRDDVLRKEPTAS